MAEKRAAAPTPTLGGRYTIVGRIATGGMAEVLAGDDTVLGRPVAIKVMKKEERPEDEGGGIEAAHARDRMRVEARALALVAHPNVVAAYDFGTTDDGRPFIVTERLQGRSLDAELRARGSVPWEEAVEIARQVLSALGAMHEKGIVHRDVKPGNVFLCAGGAVKLLDFGVAKILGEGSIKHLAPAYRTKKGSLVGTPKYITPEQASGEPVDGRTDVYAVGLLLYVLVTGEHAFAGAESVEDWLSAMRASRVRLPSAAAPRPVPGFLDRAVLKALAWDASLRFQSAAAFAEALGGAASDEDLDAPTLVLPRGVSRAALVAAFALSAAVAFAVVLLAGGGR